MSEPTILAIDTATENCSVALSHNGKLYVRSEVAPQKHANLVLPMITALLDEARIKRQDLDCIGFGSGPGSFTGVRIGVSTAQALALGLDKQVFGVSDLKLLVGSELIAAQEQQDYTAYGLGCIDARMGEVYYALYRLDRETQQLPALLSERVGKPEQALSEVMTALQAESVGAKQVIVAGTGIKLLDALGLEEQLTSVAQCALQRTEKLYPEAEAILAVASFAGMTLTDASLAEPLYCRNEVTWKKVGEQQHQ